MALIECFRVIDWPVWSITLAVKVTILVGLALIVSSVLCRYAARYSRLLWAAIFASVAILPAATIIAPTWNVPLLSSTASADFEHLSAGLWRSSGSESSVGHRKIAPYDPSNSAVDRSTRSHVPIEEELDAGQVLFSTLDRLPYIFLLVWGAVGSLALSGVIWSLLRNSRQLRLAEPMRDVRWHHELGRMCRKLGIRRTVRLVVSSTGSVPMTSGVVWPVIILPPSAPTWTEERMHVVLLHELIHVKRNDWLTEIVGRIGRAIHWFNPLMWIALRNWRFVCEQGCDTLVIANGAKPSSYAHLLLEFAEEAKRNNRDWTSPLAMATDHSLEARLMTILRPPNSAQMGFATLPLMGAVLITAIIASVVIQPVRQTSDQATDEPKSFFLKWGEIGNFHGSLSSYEDGFVNFVGDHDGGELVVQQKLDDDIRFVLRESGAVEYAGGAAVTRHINMEHKRCRATGG